MVNKVAGPAGDAIVGALYGGILMLASFAVSRAADFRHLQGASNAVFGLSPYRQNMLSMGAAVFSSVRQDGAAAFVTVLMTLCNKSFSATGCPTIRPSPQ